MCFLSAYLDISDATHDIPSFTHSSTSTLYSYTSIFKLLQFEVAKLPLLYISGTRPDMELYQSDSIRIKLPNDKVVRVDKIPEGTTVANLLEELEKTELIDTSQGAPKLVSNGVELDPTALIQWEEVSLAYGKFPGSLTQMWLVLAWKVGFLLLACPLVLKRTLFWLDIFIEWTCFFGIVCLIFKPSKHALAEARNIDRKKHPVLDFFWLLIRSFYPTFTLEDVAMEA